METKETDLFILTIVVICVKFSFGNMTKANESYFSERIKLLEEDRGQILGASIIFTDPREVLVNKTLMSFKEKDFIDAMNTDNDSQFLASKHFFRVKKSIEKSDVFKILQLIPKGSSLHLHLSASVDMEFLLRNITKWPHLFYCIRDDGQLLFRFSNQKFLAGCSTTDSWKNIAELQQQFQSEELFHQWLFTHFSMFTDSPEDAYPDTNLAWIKFENKITTLTSLVFYEKALRYIYYELLLQHYKDNVMYVEPRVLLSGVYTLDQRELSPTETLQLYIEVTEQFKRDYPDFFGAKFIYSPHRFNPRMKIQQMVDEAHVFKQQFTDYFAGFDLVGQEDKGPPLSALLSQLLDAASKNITFFFHSGETAWFGTNVDENLVDAILLNATRIAHGVALFRHPKLYELAKAKNIAVEVCPISNQILRFVDDLRMHPATTYLQDDFPVVVGSDNPGLFSAAPLSHDWYMAFMALGGRRADLGFLKQLALNSIKYSALDSLKKSEYVKLWAKKWSEFLDRIIKGYVNS